jgi:hypothetical protein
VIAEPMRDALEDARASVDLMLASSFLGYLYALVAACFLGFEGATDWRLWLAAVAGTVVGQLAHRSALRHALNYGELVRACFDLYRRDLLKQLGFTPPRSIEEERELWRNLGQQLYRRAAERPEVLTGASSTPAPSAEPEGGGSNREGRLSVLPPRLFRWRRSRRRTLI